jgi:hypothetical protein
LSEVEETTPRIHRAGPEGSDWGGLRWVWPVVLVAVLVVAPFGCYVLSPSRSLDVVVVDKTVPFTDRREHRSLFWLLRHLKIKRSDGQPYDADTDYVGAFPGPEPGDRPERTTELTDEQALRADVVYIADTYGVYEGDLESGIEMKAALERTPKIYGGLEPSEARAARRALQAGKLVIGEFNTMASPTGFEARQAIESTLGVTWTRWIGRFFHRLENEEEVPQWMRDNYERIWRDPWDFQGPGYVLLQDDSKIEVLRVGEESGSIGLTIEREEPVDPVLRGARDGIPYPFWFDVVEPRAGTEVLASFVWDLEPEGEERLYAQGLPERFPAVVRRLAPGGGRAYYFAGDFADNLMSDRPWPFAGYLAFKRWSEGAKLAPSESAFYWRFYAPMLRSILR